MRLNRVLLLAAIISVMMFALVFTISCSGDDGKNGKNGSNCNIVEQNGLDYTVLCDDGTEVVLHGGNGQDGPNGKDGIDGENCWLNNSASGYEVRCGAGAGQVKGNLDGCSIYTDESNKYLVVLACGKYEASICNNQIFDALKEYCDADGFIGESYAREPVYCPSLDVSIKGVKYDENKQRCGWGPTDKEVYGAPATLYNYCGATDSPQPNAESYDPEQYCRYFGKDKLEAKLAGDESGDWCNGKPINKDSWKTEYCGFASIDTKARSVITGACDYPAESGGPVGPNELSFGQAYCEVKLKDAFVPNPEGRHYADALIEKPKTTYSEALCGTTENNKPNNGAWKDEYCGFASDASVETDIRTKVYTGICADATEETFKAPHYEGYNKGYCEVKFADRDSFVVRNDKITYKAFYTEDSFCNDDPNERPNDAVWKGEYCGYASANGTPVVLKGICDSGEGPSEDSYNPAEYCQYDKGLSGTFRTDEGCDNGDKINENEWKGEYCGYAARGVTATSKLTGICDDGKGPHSDEFGGGYCTVTPENKGTNTTEYTDEFCGGSGKVNENKWQSQYCGYASSTADDPTRVYNDGCDNGDGKHKNSYNQPGYCYSTGPGVETVFGEQWCNPEKKSGKFNEKGWKGEYCFKDLLVSSCKAGLVGDESVNHDSKNKCILPSTWNRCEDSPSITTASGEKKPLFRDGLCNIAFDENEDVVYDPSGTGGDANCYNRGKNTNFNIDGYPGNKKSNANGAFVQSSCTIQLSTVYANVTNEADCVAGAGTRLGATGSVPTPSAEKQYTTPNSNCFGGNLTGSVLYAYTTTGYAGGIYTGYSGTIMHTSARGKGPNTVNTIANLGYSWWHNPDAKIIETFKKTCSWENNACKIVVEQASTAYPKAIGAANCNYNTYSSPATGNTPQMTLKQECRYVP